jgi:endonuclease YncB( thermonuclease family)
LRGLDCPELSTAEGKAAKRFVDALVAKASAITINTTKPDKYDRYLADVFLSPERGESPEVTGESVYLNHALLEGGHAVRKDAWEFGDWEPGLIK